MTVGLMSAFLLWLAAGWLATIGVGRGDSALDPGFILLCGLVLLAPTFVALPAGIRCGAPWWALEAIAAWSLLGYLFLFVDPAPLGRGPALALVVPAITVASASLALPYRAWRGRSGQSRRLPYTLALIPGGLSLIAGAGALEPANIVLVVLIATTAFIVWRQSTLPARPRRPAIATVGRPPVAAVPPRRASPARSRALTPAPLRTAARGT